MLQQEFDLAYSLKLGKLNRSRLWQADFELDRELIKRLTDTASQDRLILAVILISYLILISPDLLPTIHDILPHDEAKYIDSGRSLLGFQLRQLSWGPLVAAFYAPLHLVFGSSPDWFLLEAWVGRILLFALLWSSALYLASKLNRHVGLYIVVGVMFVSTAFIFVVRNQSDALLASFSAIALAELIAFRQDKKLRRIWIGSSALGLAVLSRADALPWLALFAVVALAIGFRTLPIGRILVAALVPALGFLAGFIAISRISTGSFDDGIASLSAKAYDSFEQNQSVLTGGDLEAPMQQASELYGTREENRGSVLRAILKNPSAFGLRIATNLRNTPDLYLAAFGKRVGPILLLFASLGIIALIRKGEYSLLAIMLLWSIPSAIYLAFLHRHVISTLAFLPILFASIGITHAFRRDVPRFEIAGYILVAVMLIAYSWIDSKPAFLAAGVVLTVVLALIWLVWPRFSSTGHGALIAFFLLLVGGMVLRDNFAFPNYRELGASSEEHAIQFLQATLPKDSLVAVPNPNFAIASIMDDFPINEIPPITSSEDLHSWLADRGVSAVFVHSGYLRSDSQIDEIMREGRDKYFEVGLSEGKSQIFLVRDLRGRN